MENKFIKKLNKNLRSSARFALSAGEYFLKKKISLFFILFISQTLFSLDFFIAPYTGVMFGKLGGYLYDSSDSYICSYLEWEEKPLCFIGLDAGLEHNNFQFDVAFDYTLPLACGKMYDSDWNEDGIKHTYSINNNKNLLGINTYLDFSYKFKITPKFSISPVFDINYKYYSFLANNGHGWYGGANFTGYDDDIPWDNSNPSAKYYKKLSRVSYYRHTVNFYTGLDFNFIPVLNHVISIGLFTNIYSYTSAYDYHYDDSYSGYDYFMQPIQNSFFNNIKVNISYEYLIKRNLSLLFDIEYEQGFMTKGFFMTNSLYKVCYKSEQPSGSDFFDFKTCIGIKYSF